MQNIQVVRATDETERETAARQAADTLALGGLVVHPTETIYGIGGDGSAENNRAIQRVKRREVDQPFLVLVPDLKVLHAAFPQAEWPEQAEAVARWCWPGPLTLVVRCKNLPQGLEGPGGGLALRISPDPMVSAILKHWQRPMTSTSANFQGREPARTFAQAMELFAARDDLCDIDRPVLAVDAGPSKGGTPSTILSFVEKRPRLLRQGPVSREQLLTLVQDLM
jgi:L-threonylcarbamoyladenylate synthase